MQRGNFFSGGLQTVSITGPVGAAWTFSPNLKSHTVSLLWALLVEAVTNLLRFKWRTPRLSVERCPRIWTPALKPPKRDVVLREDRSANGVEAGLEGEKVGLTRGDMEREWGRNRSQMKTRYYSPRGKVESEGLRTSEGWWAPVDRHRQSSRQKLDIRPFGAQ